MSIQTIIRIEAMGNEVFDFLQVGEEYRIDSRDVAPGIGIEHKHFLETLRTYQTDLEDFSLMPFEAASVKTEESRGTKYQTYVMLNRNQTLFAITLSRNTEQVVMWKKALIDALDQLEKQVIRLATQQPQKRFCTKTQQLSLEAALLDHLRRAQAPMSVRDLMRNGTRVIRKSSADQVKAVIQTLVVDGQVQQFRNGKAIYYAVV